MQMLPQIQPHSPTLTRSSPILMIGLKTSREVGDIRRIPSFTPANIVISKKDR
jgi:hypothetical protein